MGINSFPDCYYCDKKIKVGDRVVAKSGYKGKRKYFHEDCYNTWDGGV